MVGNSAIRALGDTKTPGTIMLIAGLTNIVLDPLFIFGLGPFPRLEIRGAAIATVLSRSITFFVAIYVLTYREKLISFKNVLFSEMIDSWKKIFYVGGPAAITRIIVPFSAGIITALLASVGAAEVAGFGVATRFERFALLFIMSLSTVMAPFVGQNFGAGKIKRIHGGINFASQMSMITGAGLLIILWVLARPLASIFSRDPAVIKVAVIYFRIVPIAYGLQGIFNISSMILNALNKPIHAALLTVFQMFIIYIPLAFLGKIYLGTTGIFSALAVSYIIAGILSFFLLRSVIDHHTGNI